VPKTPRLERVLNINFSKKWKIADSPTSRDPAIVDACHTPDRRRHKLQLVHVDVRQILENFCNFRTLNGNQASVFLELDGDVQPLTESGNFDIFKII